MIATVSNFMPQVVYYGADGYPTYAPLGTSVAQEDVICTTDTLEEALAVVNSTPPR